MAEQDFKYLLQDFTKLYLGGKLTYDEILEHEDAPMKLKTVIARIICGEVDGGTTLENHLFFMDRSSRTYGCYKKMKALFKLNVWDGKKGHYVTRILNLDQVLEDKQLMENKDTVFLAEVIITKLGLMGFVV